ncbi:hypothetical protein [Nannocystis bainbridge]|uniref:Uncharacterized protein n=1 Tax=Nannocystis bainbridge TaxID=2995303 RepID=A0ABT5EAI9_9BACT|nr:hypothetical protein [Nannocystis bainbridge]MDC0721953.1 hypothetical protein [Nannocystis bainbridge]
MIEHEALPAREYGVWIWAVTGAGSVISELVAARLARDPARLDAEARSALEFRVGLDLASLQRGRDAELRALFREVSPALSGTAQTAVAAAAEGPGYLPARPLGMAYVQQIGTALGENPRNHKPPAGAPASGLLARRGLAAGGTVRITTPTVEGTSTVSSATIRALLQGLRESPRLWAHWCNLCTIHRGWAKGFSSCAGEAAAALPESERPAVLAWLAEADWWSTPGSGALRGSTVVETFTCEVKQRAVVRTLVE